MTTEGQVGHHAPDSERVRARRIPGHGLSRHPIEVWRHNGRCVCSNEACPNNAAPVPLEAP